MEGAENNIGLWWKAQSQILLKPKMVVSISLTALKYYNFFLKP
jgi:hypothetical protein